MTNQELIKSLIPLWHAERTWAIELLRQSLSLGDEFSVMEFRQRGMNVIAGTNWMYRPHGIGVDVCKTMLVDGRDLSLLSSEINLWKLLVGGIDFDFDQPNPDPWRLMLFFARQYNDGNLNKEMYRALFEDEVMLKKELKEFFEPKA